MKKITILKDGVVTHGPVIKPEPEATEWLNDCIAKNKFGESGTYQVVNEDYVRSYSELREEQYRIRIDPFIAEAMTDHHAGDSTKLNALLAEKDLIKQEHPKPA